ncbi:MAG: ribosome maturation factor RimP [Flavobacteriales bacterium]|nr:ribosome maturation factor RimP [Flavobacteriales bacterium]
MFVVEVALKGNAGNQRLMVFLDGDKGVQIDKCAEVSRRLGHEIEERNLIDNKYILEVSSAGMGKPLKVKRQFLKNKGRELEVTLKNGETLTGILDSSDEEKLTLRNEEKKETIPFEEIEKSIVLVSFK